MIGPRGLLTLRLGGARFGIWIEEVLEVLRTPPITRLPLTPPEVAGVTSVRGDIVPVLDLGLRLLGEPAARPGRLVLVRDVSTGGIVGMLVDDVDTLLEAGTDDVRETPAEAEAELPEHHVAGVVMNGDGAVAVLNLEAAAASPAVRTEER